MNKIIVNIMYQYSSNKKKHVKIGKGTMHKHFGIERGNHAYIIIYFDRIMRYLSHSHQNVQ